MFYISSKFNNETVYWNGVAFVKTKEHAVTFYRRVFAEKELASVQNLDTLVRVSARIEEAN